MTLREDLAWRLHGAVTIVGIGNPQRGDDAFGSLLAQGLAGRVAARVIDAQDVPENYLFSIASGNPDTVLLADAVDLGEAPGTAALVPAKDLSDYLPTTHRVPLALLVDVLHAETDAQVVLLAAQPRHTVPDAPPSPEMAATLASLVETIAELLAPPRIPVGRPVAAGRAPSC
jgi:hydrogenase 3 maturation protease